MAGSRTSAGIDTGDLSGAFALLAEMTQDFADSLDLETTLARALGMIVAHLDAEAGSLWLLEPGGREVVCRASVGPIQIAGTRLPIDRGIIGRSVRENACEEVLDARKDPAFEGAVDADSGFRTHSLLCAPLSFSDRALGAIEVINKRGGDGHFAAEDIHPLQVLASSAALAIANQRLAAAQVEHERVRRELELAAEIQRGLLPPPRRAPFPVFGVNRPARTVSGDFFDILTLRDGEIAFCVGDVSGKGMNAAMLMAKTTSLYRCLAKSVERPGALLALLNQEICETATRGMFVTLVAGALDPKTGLAVLASAGHEPALLRAVSGGFASLPAQAPPLGIASGLDFPESPVELSGGTLYLCSDGLTEACSETGAFLGAEGVKRLIERFADLPLAERVEAMAAEVSRRPLRDDLTILAVEDAAARERR